MKHLLLIPTDLERRILLPRLSGFSADSDHADLPSGTWLPRLCGFGLVVAAARTAELLARYRPDSVILAGIAGALDPNLPLGSACEFDRVLVDGIGVGDPFATSRRTADEETSEKETTSASTVPPSARVSQAEREEPRCSNHDLPSAFQSAAEMGWAQWPGSPDTPPIGDSIALHSVHDQASPTEAGDGLAAEQAPSVGLSLLSVCAASANPGQAAIRRLRYSQAAAEDMEGFAVAAACRLAGVPLGILRGISNRAGDRELARWQTAPALTAVASSLNHLLSLEQRVSSPLATPAIGRPPGGGEEA